jgi:hypothetical protein
MQTGAEDPASLQKHLESRLRSDLGVSVAVELVRDGSLAEAANLGREGKARRLLDLRKSTTGQPA